MTNENNTQEASSVQRLVRRWYFTLEDYDDTTEYIGPDGESIDDCEAKRNPFIGTLNEAAEEADRRANRWEEREDCCAAQVTYHSMGKVKDGEAPNITDQPSAAPK